MAGAARVVEWVRTALISAALAAAQTTPLVRSPTHPAQITSEKCMTREAVMQVGDQTIAIPKQTTCTHSNTQQQSR